MPSQMLQLKHLQSIFHFQLDEYHDLPQDDLDDDDDDDDKPNNIQTLRNTRLNTRPAKNFKMEVMDF